MFSFKFKIKKKVTLIVLSFIVIISPIFLLTNYSLAQSNGIKIINEQIQAKKEEVEKLQERVNELQQSIKARQSQAASLSNQLAILEQRIEQLEIEIEITNNQIEETNLEIAQSQAEISKTEEEIADQKDKLAAFIRTLYKLDQKSEIEILLLNGSISDFFSQIEANIKLQENLDKAIDSLKDKKLDLQSKIKNLQEKKLTLELLQGKLDGDKLRLGDQSAARARLLSETRNSEARFKSLLQEAKAEQIQINADIQSLEKVIRQKLEGQGPSALDKLGSGKFIYPVPFRGITAYFHDPDYPYRYIFEHPAVDLRSPQGSPVKASAPGFVARTRDGGKGYSYIMLIHANGLSTVYGHVSKILVQEDQFVNQGDVIALTGGSPGTPGAGRLTTGPHVHFEIRLKGIPVNPLNYLPKL